MYLNSVSKIYTLQFFMFKTVLLLTLTFSACLCIRASSQEQVSHLHRLTSQTYDHDADAQPATTPPKDAGAKDAGAEDAGAAKDATKDGQKKNETPAQKAQEKAKFVSNASPEQMQLLVGFLLKPQNKDILDTIQSKKNLSVDQTKKIIDFELQDKVFSAALLAELSREKDNSWINDLSDEAKNAYLDITLKTIAEQKDFNILDPKQPDADLVVKVYQKLLANREIGSALLSQVVWSEKVLPADDVALIKDTLKPQIVAKEEAVKAKEEAKPQTPETEKKVAEAEKKEEAVQNNELDISKLDRGQKTTVYLAMLKKKLSK